MKSLLAATAFLILPQLCHAQAFIEKVWPPVLQRGRANVIKLSGTKIDQPVGLWTSMPGAPVTVNIAEGNARADGKSATLEVTVPADVPLGLYGLRLATKSGLSNVHLFLFDELPVTLRPADAPEAPLPVSLPAAVVATCRKALVDRYAIDVKAGERVAFEVVGNRLGKDYDPLVTVRDSRGRMVAQGDNDAGLFFDCRFAATFAEAGRYTVEISDARYQGDPTWSYVLRMGDFPVARTAVPAGAAPGVPQVLTFPQMPGVSTRVEVAARHPLGLTWHELRLAPQQPATWIPLEVSPRENQVEIEPNDTPDDATATYLPGAWNGVLGKPGDEDWFRFELQKGESIRVRARTDRIGSAADLELVLYEPTNDPAGRREVLRNDETSTRDNERNTNLVDEANFAFNARTDGYHWIQVRDLGGAGSPAHTYRLDVGPNTPEMVLKSEFDVFTAPRGGWQPVPLKITRTGFAGPIELTLVGAPPGVTLEPATIPEAATEFIPRLVVADSAVEGLATLQIVGRARIENKDKKDVPPVVVEAIATAHPLIDRQLRNKDRITYALRADQQQLPPSLTDRIALQVTAPSPFDVELPDQDVLLPKYQTTDFRVVTKRAAGFESPIVFGLDGGQIGDESEERVQIYARVPDAMPASPEVTGRLFNRILTQYQKHRVDVKATARAGDREVTLYRTFTLDVKPAFDPQFEKPDTDAMAGEAVKLKVKAGRLSTFDGPVTLTASQPVAAIAYPETIEIPKGKDEVEISVTVKPNTQPSRYGVRYEATAVVGGYQETRNATFNINVKAPPAPAKK